MNTQIGSRTYEVKETNGKFFYWSPLARRWLPVAKAKVAFNPATTPGHTDMMVPPETLDAWLEKNPLPE